MSNSTSNSFEIPLGYKRCSRKSKCCNPQGPILPASNKYFQNCRSRPDGLQCQCKMCHQQSAKDSYYKHHNKNLDRGHKRNKRIVEQNKAKIETRKIEREQTAQIRALLRKEKVRANTARRYAESPEKQHELDRKYRQRY